MNGSRRQADSWIAMGLALYSLGIVLWLLSNGVRLTQEDGFYYFKIGRNIAHGLGPTFDGLAWTNGYHPLWLFCLIPLFWLTSTTDAALLWIALLQALFMAAGTVLFYYIARLNVGRLAAAVAALIWLLFIYRLSLGGLEFSLHALCLLAVAYIYLYWFSGELPHRLRPYLDLGLVLSLTFLARLDTLLVAVIIWGWLFWGELKRGLRPAGLKQLAVVGLPVGLAVLIYSGVNLYFFDYPLPVSSLVKRSWSAYLLAHDPRYLEQGWLLAKGYHLLWPLLNLDRLYPFYLASGVFGAGGLGLLSLFISHKTSQFQVLPQVLRGKYPFILYSLLGFLGYGLMYHASLSFPPWYFVIQPWLAALLSGLFLDRFSRLMIKLTEKFEFSSQARRLILAGVIALGSLAPFYTARSMMQWRDREQLSMSPDQPLLNAAQWAKAHLPLNATIGAWNAGNIGYVSEQRVVNLDGVVNSWDYYRAERHDLCRYWQQQGITYLVDVFDERQALSVTPTYPYYARCAGQLELLWVDDRYGAAWSVRAYKVRPFEELAHRP